MENIEILWSGMQGVILNIGFVVLGFFFHAYLTRVNAVAANQRSVVILNEAKKHANSIKHEASVTAHEKLLKIREQAEKEQEQRRQSIIALEDRVMSREKDISRKLELLDNKERELEGKLELSDNLNASLKEKKRELAGKILEENNRIQGLSNFSKEKARAIVISRVEQELEREMSGMIRHQQKTMHEKAWAEARDIICSAIERYAGEHVGNITITQISLPSNSIKGCLIGKEGRNIKSFETQSGVNLLIDESPGMVLLSSFDPVRREVARIALERLMKDGRIHPVSIEKTLKNVRGEIEEMIRRSGENALFELEISGVEPALIKILGRLKFRTSYGQNVLDHSIETASLMAMMAADLDLNVDFAKRVGLFHDLGKAVDHKVKGSHAIIGGNLLRKYGENPLIYNAVASHHDDVEKSSVYATLASAADAITAARPGARMNTTDLYLQRLNKLEKIASSFKGVNQAYAIQAGHELRVIVNGAKVDDNRVLILAREIANEIQKQINYPGQIKVTVIRETRAIEYVK